MKLKVSGQIRVHDVFEGLLDLDIFKSSQGIIFQYILERVTICASCSEDCRIAARLLSAFSMRLITE